MKVSFIKFKDDKDRYKIAKMVGMDVFELDSPEDVDKQIQELEKQNYRTIFIPDSLASFSDEIVSKYKYNDSLKIIITPSSNNNEL
jgi:vacuolar-type H+-ATPase subunit F/Vma7